MNYRQSKVQGLKSKAVMARMLIAMALIAV